MVGELALLKERTADQAEGPLAPSVRTRQKRGQALGQIGGGNIAGCNWIPVCAICVKVLFFEIWMV